MAKKKRQHSDRKKKRLATRPPASPQAMALGQQFVGQTPDQFMARLERGLMGSWVLRQEQEFSDFYFDPDSLLNSLVRHQERYEARFAALGEINDKNRDIAHQLYDEFRIDVIADLVTLEVRSDLQKRAERCRARLQRGQDTDRLEMILYVSTLLSQAKPLLPLGVCALFTVIFEESKEQALKIEEGHEALVAQITAQLPKGAEPDMEQLLAIAQQPDRMAQFLETLDTHPETRASLERDMDRMIDEVSEAVRYGKLPLDLFTEDEVLLTYADLFIALESKSPKKRLDKEANARLLVDAMKRNLNELVTPARNRQIRQKLDALSSEMQRSSDQARQKMGAKLFVVASTLDSWAPGKHPLVVSAYVYQAEQMRAERMSGGNSADWTERMAQLVAERSARKR